MIPVYGFRFIYAWRLPCRSCPQAPTSCPLRLSDASLFARLCCAKRQKRFVRRVHLPLSRHKFIIMFSMYVCHRLTPSLLRDYPLFSEGDRCVSCPAWRGREDTVPFRSPFRFVSVKLISLFTCWSKIGVSLFRKFLSGSVCWCPTVKVHLICCFISWWYSIDDI